MGKRRVIIEIVSLFIYVFICALATKMTAASTNVTEHFHQDKKSAERLEIINGRRYWIGMNAGTFVSCLQRTHATNARLPVQWNAQCNETFMLIKKDINQLLNAIEN